MTLSFFFSSSNIVWHYSDIICHQVALGEENEIKLNLRDAKQYSILQDLNLEEISDLCYRFQSCNEFELSGYRKIPVRPATSAINLNLGALQSYVYNSQYLAPKVSLTLKCWGC